MTDLEADERKNPAQRGIRRDVFGEDTKIILLEPIGCWCAVIGDRMYQVSDFQRGPLCRPRIEIQARAALKAQLETYYQKTHAETILSPEKDDHLSWLLSMVCLQIANAVPTYY